MGESNDAAFVRHVVDIIFSSPAAEEWASWDDVFHWVQDHPEQVGGPGLAWQYMEALDRTQRHGVPFTRDPAAAARAIARHLGPIEAIHERGT
jgi:hypothetical protein